MAAMPSMREDQAIEQRTEADADHSGDPAGRAQHRLFEHVAPQAAGLPAQIQTKARLRHG